MTGELRFQQQFTFLTRKIYRDSDARNWGEMECDMRQIQRQGIEQISCYKANM